MPNYKKSVGTAFGILGLKEIGKTISDNIEYATNKTSLSPFDADELNKGENETIKQMERESLKRRIHVPERKPDINKISPLQRNVASWSDDDLKEVMFMDDYKNDGPVRKKVKSYFDYKYPGPQRFDATGRPY